MSLTTTILHVFLWLVVLALAAYMVALLLDQTAAKEGFRSREHEDVENPLTPQQFSYELLQGVMGPIRRLSSRITDLGMWKERFEMAQMTPGELARRHLGNLKTRGV